MDRAESLAVRMRPTRQPPALGVGCGLALLVGGLCAWLCLETIAARFLAWFAWPLAAVCFARGASERQPRLLMHAAMTLALTTIVTWALLVATLHTVPSGGQSLQVFAGWPHSFYLGSVHGRLAPSDLGVAGALSRNFGYCVLALGIVLARAAPSALARWLPHACAVAGVTHLVGFYWLAFATDG